MNIGLLTSVGSTLDAFFPEIVQAWEENGSQVGTAASTTSPIGDFTLLRSVTRRPGLKNMGAPAEIKRWLKRTGADVLVTNTATASAMARVQRMPVPVVYFCHGLHWNKGTSPADKLWRTVEAALTPSTAGVIVLNGDDEEWFRTRLPPHRILRLELGVGVPLASYPRTAAMNGKQMRLLWAGEFSKRKQPLQAIEVMKHLRDAGSDVVLTMLGEGALRDVTIAKVQAAGLSDVISVPGRLDFAPHMIRNDAILHTAKWEGLPRVLLEGFAMGRRSYAYDVKGVRDIPEVTLAADADTRGLADLIRRDILSGRIRQPTKQVDGLETFEAARRIYEFLQRVLATPVMR
ncbi:glycosyltransferase [Cryobacterium sp. N19]|uniref:glycosyltransferase n=1 Tax=Cryobacterium sp. N19 TaxID=2048288 RepID=UPI001304AAE0|nr:glycosyltransferase [Cryobacterium sp. N19]